MDTPLFIVLEVICTLLQSSRSTYLNYLNNGKTFQYAQELRVVNNAIMRLIRENKQIFPSDLKESVNSLMEHYEAWTVKWDALEQVSKPKPNDVFVFENEIRFPREAAIRLEEYRRREENDSRLDEAVGN